MCRSASCTASPPTAHGDDPLLSKADSANVYNAGWVDAERSPYVTIFFAKMLSVIAVEQTVNEGDAAGREQDQGEDEAAAHTERGEV
jgi:hypothetical protein